MRTRNAPVDELMGYIRGKEVYIYGVGDFYRRLSQKAIYPGIHKSVAGYIDNGREGKKITVLGQEYPIHGVGFLKSVRRGIVLLCGTIYLDEMYALLAEQRLPDEIECFIMPLVWTVSDGKDDPEIVGRLCGDRNPAENKIEKRIHCCWFSGEKKPDKYQRCIDTWKRTCPDYEIMEWNASNYDCGKNRFMKQAYENQKWAFVSDYARLDVVYQYGGIYLDMDVELLKDFQPLLGYDAFFNYGMRHMIELGSGYGSVKGNPFIGRLLGTYEDEDFTDQYGRPQTDKFVQPRWIDRYFKEAGFRLDGSMQLVGNMLILPRRFYTPKDDMFLWNCLQCEDTRGIHHFNSDWRPQEYLERRKGASAWMAEAVEGTMIEMRSGETE